VGLVRELQKVTRLNGNFAREISNLKDESGDRFVQDTATRNTKLEVTSLFRALKMEAARSSETYQITTLRGATTQKTTNSVFTAVKTSNLATLF
jgi:hypothetical protein